jgi:hypothetical protein
LDELERASVSGFEEATTAESEEAAIPGAATGKPTLREVSCRLNLFVFSFSCFILVSFQIFF